MNSLFASNFVYSFQMFALALLEWKVSDIDQVGSVHKLDFLISGAKGL